MSRTIEVVVLSVASAVIFLISTLGYFVGWIIAYFVIVGMWRQYRMLKQEENREGDS